MVSISKYARAISAALSCLLILGSGIAQAAAARKGGSAKAIEALSRGNAVAYDSINKVYLVVSSNGVLYGRFVNSDGIPITLPFTIQANPNATTNYAHFPRV